jgi:hypothetical protein
MVYTSSVLVRATKAPSPYLSVDWRIVEPLPLLQLTKPRSLFRYFHRGRGIKELKLPSHTYYSHHVSAPRPWRENAAAVAQVERKDLLLRVSDMLFQVSPIRPQ